MPGYSHDETSPGPDDQAFPRRSSTRRPALWTGLAAAAAFVTGIVFFLLPVTAIYYLDDAGNPTHVRTIYGTRNDQMLGLPANILGPGDPPEGTWSVRIGCGTALDTPASRLGAEQHGAEGCAEAERPRMIVGWLGVGAGLLGAVGVLVLRRRQLRPNAAQTHFPPSAGS
ncbi:hypothetical protein F9C11_05380 [Amycolatopsis sp. VS8301801F10]|uniref:hypothetical protein n=1 Tax=Amycolatopsis sp. VS8301801F10 TaxID=2652442 RepID=UPI0038FCC2EC